MLHNEVSNNFYLYVVLVELAAVGGKRHTGLYRILILTSQGKGPSESIILNEY
jgi:hypothetical protein